MATIANGRKGEGQEETVKIVERGCRSKMGPSKNRKVQLREVGGRGAAVTLSVRGGTSIEGVQSFRLKAWREGSITVRG